MSDQFPNKYLKKIESIDGFLDGVASMDTEEIKAKILKTEGNIYEIDNSKEVDAELASSREKTKQLAAPYRESKGLEVAKLQYYLFVLESRGINL